MDNFRPWLFFKALFSVWWPLMSCAIFTVLGVISERLKWTDAKQTRAILIVAALLWMCSSYFAWEAEYEKTNPGLHLALRTLLTQARSDTSTRVIFFASISNWGEPSVADTWKLTVKPSGGTAEIESRPVAIGGDSPLHIVRADGTVLDYPSTDELYEKVASVPVPNGGKQSGFVIFDVLGLPQLIAEAPGTIYTLTCNDVHGNPISGQFTKHANMDHETRFVPGMEHPAENSSAP